MTDLSNFRDRANFEHIRDNLYTGAEYGRAAVMIGAGFSRNAEKFSQYVPDFPLAKDLGEIFYSKLHPEYDRSSQESLDFGENFDIYATEYSKKFGKSELYSLLIHSIPDEQYLPGELHELLLSLPWSDIFTTNYDTLLERTLPKIYDKKYDVVKTVTQIPQVSKPRIVKLHGDIPSNSFIITTEDYESYKEKYAAFQNLVQQSILENIFCLIGFRGKDKNFNKWREWVKENLGEHAPPIYLCGVLDLSDSEKEDYEKDNIKIVDLGPLFPLGEYWDENKRHKNALEWFLKSLKSSRPENKLNWPQRIPRGELKMSNPIAPPLLSPRVTAPLVDRSYTFQPSDKSAVENNCNIWTKERESYPGWIIIPKDNREIIWEETKYTINPLLENLGNIAFPQNIRCLFELTWRLQICLIPLVSNIAESIESVIKTINPFPDLIERDETAINPHMEEYKSSDWHEIITQWTYLAYSLVQYYRESNNLEKYQTWIEYLEKLNDLDTNWSNKWHYEKCMQYIFQIDQDGLRDCLNSWPLDDDSLEYQLKKAGLLAELGELDKAQTITERTLQKIRSHLHSNPDNIYLLSLEGWCMFLLQSIKPNDFGIIERGGYKERWEQLARYHCNPWIELEKLRASVSIQKPQKQPTFEIKSGFDLGTFTKTYHMGGEPEIFQFFPAFEFLRLYETVGLPMKCGMVSMFTKEVINASSWIEKYDPMWALSATIRTGDTSAIEKKFERPTILQINEKLFDKYYELSMKSLGQSIKEYYQEGNNPDFYKSFSYRQLILQMELLSRLSIRLSDRQLTELLDLAIKIYEHRNSSPNITLNKGLNTLFQRLLKAISQNKILDRIGMLLNLPIPTADYFKNSYSKFFPEPFEHIGFKSGFQIPQVMTEDHGIVRSQT